MTFLFRYFYVNWFTFFVCFKLKSYINIKITKAKRKIWFWQGFSSLQYFFSLQTWQKRISHRQPQIQTNRYQVLVLSCQWNYTISKSFFQIKWLNNAGFSRNNPNLSIQLFVTSRAQFSLIIVRFVFVKRAVYCCLVFYNPLFRNLLKNAVAKLIFKIRFLIPIWPKRSAKIF